MADQETWAKRVSEWRSSGLTSTAYCEGKPFTAGGLRHWAHRLSRGRQQDRPAVRVARLVRVSELRSSSQDELSPAVAVVPDVVVEIGTARIAVRPGFDRGTLAAVLDVLAATTRSPR
jgi:transposase